MISHTCQKRGWPWQSRGPRGSFGTCLGLILTSRGYLSISLDTLSLEVKQAEKKQWYYSTVLLYRRANSERLASTFIWLESKGIASGQGAFSPGVFFSEWANRAKQNTRVPDLKCCWIEGHFPGLKTVEPISFLFNGLWMGIPSSCARSRKMSTKIATSVDEMFPAVQVVVSRLSVSKEGR